jgi:hypothetical protein
LKFDYPLGLSTGIDGEAIKAYLQGLLYPFPVEYFSFLLKLNHYAN